MSGFLTVLALALLPAGGNVVGSLLAEMVKTPAWLIGAALHAAAGIAIAVVSIELTPRIIGELPPWLLVAAFLLGAAFSVGVVRGVKALNASSGGDKQTGAGPWMVYIAIAADLFSDGLLTGAGSAVASRLGFVLAASQFVANIPGGFATGANFRKEGVGRSKRLAIAASFPAPVFVSAVLGFWLLQDASEATKNTVLAFIMGVLLLATVEDTLPEGDQPQPPRWISTASFAGGFTGFALMSLYLG